MIGVARLYSRTPANQEGRPCFQRKGGESVTRKLLLMVVLVAAVTIACRPALAHHGAAAYDVSKTATIKGTVKTWNWSNPHCLLFVDATDDAGQVVQWIFETQNPLSMSNLGWGNDSFKPGDQITVRATPAKNGRPIGLVVDVVQANGHKLNARNIFVEEQPKTDASPKQ
jgi:hypothetical protein